MYVNSEQCYTISQRTPDKDVRPSPYTLVYNYRALSSHQRQPTSDSVGYRIEIVYIRIQYTINQRPDQYTCQVSVYLPSISILIIILSILIFKYWYWYFLFQKRTEKLILQYYFCHQYQYFSISFEATKIVFLHFYWSCVDKCANIGFIWALEFVSHNKSN